VGLKEGDLVITLPQVMKIRAIIDNLTVGQIGVVVMTSARFGEKTVYGVLVDGEIYYLFEDEIAKVEEQ